MHKNPLTIQRNGTSTNIGDPFVLKYNGVYYLYPSTNHDEVGIYCYQSKNFIDWTFVGCVCDDPITKNAYAPEVILVKDRFLLITSPGGNGHYLFESLSPMGPFQRVTKNLNHMIDGSFYYENQTLYVLRANHQGIVISELNEHYQLLHRVNLDANLHAWTEGPNLFKRNGLYYLTYCGNHLFSDGYRVEYSVSNSLFGPYQKGLHNPLLISVHPEYKALGHSSVVVGPDLDTYYHVYHQLEFKDNIPYRHFCFDRLDFNHSILKQSITHDEVQPPCLPSMMRYHEDDQEGFELTSGKWKATQVCGKEFTIECNVLASKQPITLFLQEKQKKEWVFTVFASSITIQNLVDGGCTVVGKYPVALHKKHWNSIVFKQKTQLELWFQNECVWRGPSLNHPTFGWNQEDIAHIGFVGISQRCYQDVDSVQIAPSLVFFDSLPKEYVGYGINAFASTIDSKGVSQTIAGEGRYLLSLCVESGQLHALELEINNRPHHVIINASNEEYPYVKLPCLEVSLHGITTLKLRCPSKVVKVLYAELERLDYYESLINEESKIDEVGIVLQNPIGFIDEISVQIHIKKRLTSAQYGLLVNVKEYSKHPGQCHFGMLGYFIGFYQDLLIVDRLAYGATRIYDIPFAQTKESYHLKVSLYQGIIEVYVDGVKRIECSDPHMYYTGQFGFYQNQSCWIEFESLMGGKKHA